MSKSELEFAGIKFKGGKLIGILIALSTLVGGAYGAFEVYKDYMDMKEQIQSYVAPDLSQFNREIGEINQTVNGLQNQIKVQLDSVTVELNAVKELVVLAQDDARTIRNDLRKDLNEIQDGIVAVDKRSRDADIAIRASMRENESTVRNIIQSAETRFSQKRTQLESDFQRKSENIDTKLKELEERLRTMLERALTNPLTGN